MKNTLISMLFLIFLVLPLNLAYGQVCCSTSSAIRGEIKDTGGNVVAGAVINLEPLGETREAVLKKGTSTKMLTDEQGEYYFQLPPGLYKLSVEKNGFIGKEVLYSLIFRRTSSVNFSLALSSSGLLSQTVSGALVGVITKDAVPIKGVRVIAVNLMDNTITESFTNEDGFYNFPQLLPGNYSIKVDAEVEESDFSGLEEFVNSANTKINNFTIKNHR